MPEYSTPKLTPTETTKITSMDGANSGYILTGELLDIIRATFGQANGVATLGADGKLTSGQLPDLADDVIVVSSYSTLPATGTASKIYITADTNKMYRWDDSLATPDYVELSIDLSDYATKADLLDGTIEPLISTKARQDQNGNVIDTTYAKKADLLDGTIVVKEAEIATKDEDGNNIKATYETKAEASDLKSAIDRNSNRISNLEQEHGSYVPVNYRGDNAVPTGKAKYGLVESIVGKSRAWNQMMDTIRTSTTIAGNVSFINNNDGSYTINGTASSTGGEVAISNDYIPVVLGHSYLVICCPVGGSSTTYRGFIWADNASTLLASDDGNGAIITISTSYTNMNIRPYIRVFGDVTVSNKTCHVIVRDLTLIFPEGVPSTVAECVQKCPDILKYDAYGTSMVDTTVSGVRSKSTNLLNTDRTEQTTGIGGGPNANNSFDDTKWIKGISVNNYYNDTVVSNVVLGTGLVSGSVASGYEGYGVGMVIKGKASTSYYISCTTSDAEVRVACYDSTGKFINNLGDKKNTTFTSHANTAWILLVITGVNAGAFSVTNLMVAEGSSVGSYSPYGTLATLSLPSSVTLRSAGSVADTDELNVEVNGVGRRRQTERIGTYTFTGNESWTKNETFGFFFTFVLDSLIKPTQDKDAVANIICPKYTSDTPKNVQYGTNDKTISVGLVGWLGAGVIGVYDSDPPDATTFASDMAGVSINYVKATTETTLSDPIINNTIQTEGGGTIETIQTQTPVIDNSLDVGYLAL